MTEGATPLVRQELDGLTEELRPTRLLLDLGGVRFMTSTGLGMLLFLHKKLKAAGGHLTLCGVGGEIRELFEVTRLDQVLDIRREGPSSGPK